MLGKQRVDVTLVLALIIIVAMSMMPTVAFADSGRPDGAPEKATFKDKHCRTKIQNSGTEIKLQYKEVDEVWYVYLPSVSDLKSVDAAQWADCSHTKCPTNVSEHKMPHNIVGWSYNEGDQSTGEDHFTDFEGGKWHPVTAKLEDQSGKTILDMLGSSVFAVFEGETEPAAAREYIYVKYFANHETHSGENLNMVTTPPGDAKIETSYIKVLVKEAANYQLLPLNTFTCDNHTNTIWKLKAADKESDGIKTTTIDLTKLEPSERIGENEIRAYHIYGNWSLVQGKEEPPVNPGDGTDPEVRGDEDTPDEQTVLGEEAKTSDGFSTAMLLSLVFSIMAVVLAIKCRNLLKE